MQASPFERMGPNAEEAVVRWERRSLSHSAAVRQLRQATQTAQQPSTRAPRGYAGSAGPAAVTEVPRCSRTAASPLDPNGGGRLAGLKRVVAWLGGRGCSPRGLRMLSLISWVSRRASAVVCRMVFSELWGGFCGEGGPYAPRSPSPPAAALWHLRALQPRCRVARHRAGSHTMAVSAAAGRCGDTLSGCSLSALLPGVGSEPLERRASCPVPHDTRALLSSLRGRARHGPHHSRIERRA